MVTKPELSNIHLQSLSIGRCGPEFGNRGGLESGSELGSRGKHIEHHLLVLDPEEAKCVLERGIHFIIQIPRTW